MGLLLSPLGPLPPLKPQKQPRFYNLLHPSSLMLRPLSTSTNTPFSITLHQPNNVVGNLDQQPCEGAQQLHDRQHLMGSPHDLWVDRQRLVELLELHLPSNQAKQEGWVPTFHTPSMAQHPKSMGEVHSRPTTSTSLESKNIEHLRGLLAIRTLRNIVGSPRKGTSSS